jgi:acyl dehydratase
LQQTLLLRGDGGFGGAPAKRSALPLLPGRSPDDTISYKTSPRAALIYRLSGDWNPLHADPEMARRAGFERPILHGLASYGIAGWVLLNTCGNGDPGALAALSCRFSGTIYPGDNIVFSIWQDGAALSFEAFVGDRKVLDQGRATLR